MIRMQYTYKCLVTLGLPKRSTLEGHGLQFHLHSLQFYEEILSNINIT